MRKRDIGMSLRMTPRHGFRHSLLVVLVLLLVLPGVALADTPPQFILEWGSFGIGNGQFAAFSPTGLAVDASGNVYAADNGNARIQKFNGNGVFLTKWGAPGFSGDGVFNGPDGVAVDPSGNVYVVDLNHRVQKFTSNGAFILGWGTQGSGPGQFKFPKGVGVDSSGNVYVADTNNGRIQKFTSTGTFLTEWGKPGTDPGQFGAPWAVAVDSNGTVFVADDNTNRIQAFTSTGTFLMQWGCLTCSDVWGPRGIAVDRLGDVYVANTGNATVRKFGGSGAVLATWSSAGAAGVAVDASDNVFVSSSGSKIRKYGPGPVPPVTLTPSSLNYGTRPVGDLGPARTVTLKNNTTADVSVLLVDVTGPDALDFSVDLDTCSLTVVLPGGTCTIDVSFSPMATGGSRATLTVDTDALGTPHTANLSGIGTPAAFAPAGVRAQQVTQHTRATTPRPTTTPSSMPRR